VHSIEKRGFNNGAVFVKQGIKGPMAGTKNKFEKKVSRIYFIVCLLKGFIYEIYLWCVVVQILVKFEKKCGFIAYFPSEIKTVRLFLFGVCCLPVEKAVFVQLIFDSSSRLTMIFFIDAAKHVFRRNRRMEIGKIGMKGEEWKHNLSD